MSECVACLTAWAGLLVLGLGLATLRAALRPPAAPSPAVNRDYLAPDRPLYGAERLPTRDVPPVVPPPDLSARYTGRLGVYGTDILDISHGARTEREFPYCDWQGTVQERRN